MRPIKLKLQAFGPYANKEVIDFTELENRSMFVISGKTGAGKTTIFDAISYALYDEASGNDRKGDDLRSHLAKDNLLTEVELIFSLRNRTYRVTRQPNQMKPKVREEGYTSHGSTASLYEKKSDEWALITDRKTDVDVEIKQLIGLDKDQFRQILLIPQGEFRKLLVSNSNEKVKILQQLFNTNFYQMMENILKQKVDKLNTEMTQVTSQQKFIISSIQALFSNDLIETMKKQEHNYYQIIDHLENEIHLEDLEVEKLSLELDIQENKLQLVNKEFVLSTQLQAKFNQLDKLNEEYNKLIGEKTSIEEDEILLKKMENAELLQRDEQLGKTINQTLERLKKELQTEQQLLEVSKSNLEKLFVEQQKLIGQKEEIEKKEHQINQLRILRPEVEQLDQMVIDINKKQQQLIEIEGKYQSNIQLLSNTKDTYQKLEKQIQQVQLEKNELLFIERQLFTKQNLYEKLLDYSSVIREIEQLESKLTSLNNREQDIHNQLIIWKQKEEEVLYQLKNAQASILARDLIEGCNCPVCGSTEHPNKADIHADLPKEVEIETLKNKVLEVSEQHNKCLMDVSTLQIQIDFQKKRQSEFQKEVMIEDNLVLEEIEQLRNEIELLTKELKEKQLAVQQEENLHQERQLKLNLLEQLELQNQQQVLQINNLENEIKNKLENKEILLSKLPNTIQTLSEFNDVLSMLERVTLTHKQNVESIERKITDEKESNIALNKAIALLTGEVNQTQKALENQRLRFKEVMNQLGFENSAEYTSVKNRLPEKEAKKLHIEQYKMQLQSVTDRLHELQQDLEHQVKPNLLLLEETIQQLKQVINKYQDNINKLQQALKMNKKCLVDINELQKLIIDKENEYKIIADLHQMASGKNSHKISFERYVLGYYLDEILIAANFRLSKMTGGRFQLKRDLEVGKGNGPKGLEILVTDQYAGRERPVRTLSGGESFKASLALALGLSDVVSSNAGGISLDTIFIDEGFGTLDSESLNQAIDILMDIQSKGRLVGIISHVDQLKECIDARLEVYSDSSGSHTEFIFATTTT